MIVRVWYALAVQTLKDWLWSHPLLYPFILFVIACAVSVYSQDIKRFLHNWPRTKERSRRFTENDLTKRIVLLMKLHNNSYQLLLFMVYKITNYVFTCILTSILVIGIGVITHEKSIRGSIFGVAFGLFVGVCFDLRTTVNQLYRYDEAVADLQKQRSKLQSEQIMK